MTGARVVVAVVYVLLAASFLASTGLVIQEFRATDWESLVISNSHLFIFFPVLGVLALAAFYLPSVVFTDLYWRHLPYGKLRFLIGLVVLAAVSYAVAKWLDKPPRAIWEASPAALAADRGEPAGCGSAPGQTACLRAPILAAMAKLRAEGQARVGLSKFARSCATDKLLEVPEEMEKERYCFAADAKLSGAVCCVAQSQFADAVARLYESPGTRSLYANYDKVFFPLKVFFVLLLVTIGGLLAAWRNELDVHYREIMPSVERGVIIGALAMLLWPVMDYGYLQTANVLFGRMESGTQLRPSLILVPWFVILLFYFLRRLGKQGEMVGQVAGVVTAGVAVLRYEDLNDWAVRLLGVGAQHWIIAGLVVIALVGFAALLWPRDRPRTQASAPPSA